MDSTGIQRDANLGFDDVLNMNGRAVLKGPNQGQLHDEIAAGGHAGCLEVEGQHLLALEKVAAHKIGFGTPSLNITPKHHDAFTMNMGIRDWFRKPSSPEAEPPSEVDDEGQQAVAFARLQSEMMAQANALFDAPDEAEETEVQEAPRYDASEVEMDALLDEGIGEAFTHVDEVEISDVGELDDPLEDARIEGDVSQAVVFGDGENESSVGS